MKLIYELFWTVKTGESVCSEDTFQIFFVEELTKTTINFKAGRKLLVAVFLCKYI